MGVAAAPLHLPYFSIPRNDHIELHNHNILIRAPVFTHLGRELARPSASPLSPPAPVFESESLNCPDSDSAEGRQFSLTPLGRDILQRAGRGSASLLELGAFTVRHNRKEARRSSLFSLLALTEKKRRENTIKITRC